MRNKKTFSLYEIPVENYDDLFDENNSISDLHKDIQSAFKKLDTCMNNQNRYSRKSYLVDQDHREKIVQLEESNKQLKEYALNCQQDLTTLSSKFLNFFNKCSMWKHKHDMMRDENERINNQLKKQMLKSQIQTTSELKLKKETININEAVSHQSPIQQFTEAQQQYSLMLDKLQRKSDRHNIYEEVQDLLISSNKKMLPLAIYNSLQSLVKKHADEKILSSFQLIRQFTSLFNQSNSSRLQSNQFTLPSVKQLKMKYLKIRDTEDLIKSISLTENSELPPLIQNQQLNYLLNSSLKDTLQDQIQKEKESQDIQELVNLIRESKLFEIGSTNHQIKEKLLMMAKMLSKTQKNSQSQEQVQVNNINKDKNSQFFTNRTEHSDDTYCSPVKIKDSGFYFLHPYKKQQLTPKKEIFMGLYSNAIKKRVSHNLTVNDK